MVTYTLGRVFSKESLRRKNRKDLDCTPGARLRARSPAHKFTVRQKVIKLLITL